MFFSGTGGEQNIFPGFLNEYIKDETVLFVTCFHYRQIVKPSVYKIKIHTLIKFYRYMRGGKKPT